MVGIALLHWLDRVLLKGGVGLVMLLRLKVGRLYVG